MTKEDMRVIEKAIEELDTVVGMLLVAAMKDNTVKEAMEKVTQVSIKLGEMFD